MLLPILGLLFALCAAEAVVRYSGLVDFAGNNSTTMLHKTANLFNERPQKFIMPRGARTMQDADFQRAKPQDVFRIANLGDSFSFAPKMHYDDAFPKRLERMLTSGTQGRQAEVINFGFPGTSSADQARLMPSVLRYHPDLVLLQITLNDAQRVPLNREKADIRAMFEPYSANRLGILANLKSLVFVLSRLHNSQSVRHYIDYHLGLFNDQEGWQRFTSAILEMKRQCQNAGTSFAIVVFPLFDFPLDRKYPFNPIHAKLNAFFKEYKIAHLDLLAAFLGTDVRRLQLIPGRDSHPNEIAHRIAAERIYWWLLKNSLIPAEFKPARVYGQRDNIREMPKVNRGDAKLERVNDSHFYKEQRTNASNSEINGN